METVPSPPYNGLFLMHEFGEDSTSENLKQYLLFLKKSRI
jgi:hypothetical protein